MIMLTLPSARERSCKPYSLLDSDHVNPSLCQIVIMLTLLSVSDHVHPFLCQIVIMLTLLSVSDHVHPFLCQTVIMLTLLSVRQ